MKDKDGWTQQQYDEWNARNAPNDWWETPGGKIANYGGGIIIFIIFLFMVGLAGWSLLDMFIWNPTK